MDLSLKAEELFKISGEVLERRLWKLIAGNDDLGKFSLIIICPSCKYKLIMLPGYKVVVIIYIRIVTMLPRVK